jgi:hypothetical protein
MSARQKYCSVNSSDHAACRFAHEHREISRGVFKRQFAKGVTQEGKLVIMLPTQDASDTE